MLVGCMRSRKLYKMGEVGRNKANSPLGDGFLENAAMRKLGNKNRKSTNVKTYEKGMLEMEEKLIRGNNKEKFRKMEDKGINLRDCVDGGINFKKVINGIGPSCMICKMESMGINIKEGKKKKEWEWWKVTNKKMGIKVGSTSSHWLKYGLMRDKEKRLDSMWLAGQASCFYFFWTTGGVNKVEYGKIRVGEIITISIIKC